MPSAPLTKVSQQAGREACAGGERARLLAARTLCVARQILPLIRPVQPPNVLQLGRQARAARAQRAAAVVAAAGTVAPLLLLALRARQAVGVAAVPELVVNVPPPRALPAVRCFLLKGQRVGGRAGMHKGPWLCPRTAQLLAPSACFQGIMPLSTCPPAHLPTQHTCPPLPKRESVRRRLAEARRRASAAAAWAAQTTAPGRSWG